MLNRREMMEMLIGLLGMFSTWRVSGATIDSSGQTHLLIQTSSVAGFQYYSGEAVWSRITVDDELELRRQPDNEYDENAIEVFWRQKKLGYVPASENLTVSRMMDRGQEFAATIAEKNDSEIPWDCIEMNIYAVI